jgi:hypothetical protein
VSDPGQKKEAVLTPCFSATSHMGLPPKACIRFGASSNENFFLIKDQKTIIYDAMMVWIQTCNYTEWETFCGIDGFIDLA